MKKLLALLVLSIMLTGCLPGEEVTEEETQEDQQVVEDTAVDYEREILGTWYMKLTAAGGTIEGPYTFHSDGTVSGSYGDVTAFTDQGHISQRVQYGSSQGTYWIEDNSLYSDAGQGMQGSFIDTENMSGTITDNAGVTSTWTAYKIADYVIGEWMMNIEGWGEGEIARFQTLSLNADGSADTDWVKVQNDAGETNEGEIPDYLDYYSLTEDGIMIYGSEESGVTFQGDMNESGEIEGVWHNSATGDSGTWYAVAMS